MKVFVTRGVHSILVTTCLNLGTGPAGQGRGDFHAPCCPGDRESTRLSFWARKRARALRQHLFHYNPVANWKSDNSALPAQSQQRSCIGLWAGSSSSLQCLCIRPDSALSPLHRPGKRLAGTCLRSPWKSGHSTYKPPCFTWTSNFFSPDPHLLHVCRPEVYLPRSSKTITLKTPSCG